MKRSSSISVDDIAPVAKKGAAPLATETSDSQTGSVNNMSNRYVIKGNAIGKAFCDGAKVYAAAYDGTTYTYKGESEVGLSMALKHDLSSIHPHLKKGALIDSVVFHHTGSKITFEWADEEGECNAVDFKVVEFVIEPIPDPVCTTDAL